MQSPSISLVLFVSLAIALMVTPRAMPPFAFAEPTAEERMRSECDGYLQMALELGTLQDVDLLVQSEPCAAILSSSSGLR